VHAFITFVPANAEHSTFVNDFQKRKSHFKVEKTRQGIQVPHSVFNYPMHPSFTSGQVLTLMDLSGLRLPLASSQLKRNQPLLIHRHTDAATA